MAAPDGSVICPEIYARNSCAETLPARSNTNRALRRLMFSPCRNAIVPLMDGNKASGMLLCFPSQVDRATPAGDHRVPWKADGAVVGTYPVETGRPERVADLCPG